MCKIDLLTSVFLDSGTRMLEKGNTDRLKDENQRRVYTSECRQWGSGSAQGNTSPRCWAETSLHPGRTSGMYWAIAFSQCCPGADKPQLWDVQLHIGSAAWSPAVWEALNCLPEAFHLSSLHRSYPPIIWGAFQMNWWIRSGSDSHLYLRFNDSLINKSFSEIFNSFQ